jgi:LysR family glycine cleavage system transcriptional activator
MTLSSQLLLSGELRCPSISSPNGVNFTLEMSPQWKSNYGMKWSSMPSLAALRAFDAVARNDSYALAAAALNVTEAAIRQHVRSLEVDLALRLVERRGRGIALTEAGRLLAKATGDGFDRLYSGVAALKAEEAGRPIRITLPPSFAETWLMPRLGDFWAGYPDIELEVVPSLKLMDLGIGQFDLAIRYGHGDWRGCKSVYLASAEYLVVARPEIVAGRTFENPGDIKDLRWLLEAGREEHRAWAEAHGVDFEAEGNRHYPTNSLVLSALRAGQGVSLQSRALVQRDLDTGLLAVLLAEPSATLGYYIVTRTAPRPPVRRFIDWLIAAASGH